MVQHLQTGGVANANSLPVGSIQVPSKSMEPSLLPNWDGVITVGVPNIGNVRSFLNICFQDGMIISEIDAWASMSIS